MAILALAATARADTPVHGGEKAALADAGIPLDYVMFEYRSQNSWTLDTNNNVVDNSPRHVLQVKIEPHWTTAPSTITNSQSQEVDLSGAITSYLDAGWYDLHYLNQFSLAAGMQVTLPYSVSVYCGTGGQMGVLPYYAPAIPSNGSGATFAGLGYDVPRPDGVNPAPPTPVQYAGTGALTHRAFQTVTKVERNWWQLISVTGKYQGYYDGQGHYYEVWAGNYLQWKRYKQTFYRYDNLSLTKITGGDASVDTRRTYGQPDKTGALPSDPNAGLNTVNFGNWDYKGGLFVGNMPNGTGPTATHDLSGTSRAQLYFDVPAPADTFIGSILTLYPPEYVNRTGYLSSFNLDVYRPSPTDPNIGTGESDVRWDTRWKLSTSDLVGGGTLGFPRVDDYFCMSVPELTPANPRLFVTLNDSNPPTALPRNGKLNLDDPLTDQGPTGWLYFADKEWQAEHQTIPAGYQGFYLPLDSQPRVWRMGQTSELSWDTGAIWQETIG